MGKILDKEILKLAKDAGFTSNFPDRGNQYDLYIWMCKLQYWLREAHRIYVEVDVDFDHNTNELWHDAFIYTIQRHRKNSIEQIVDDTTYEDVLEKGLVEALKLI